MTLINKHQFEVHPALFRTHYRFTCKLCDKICMVSVDDWKALCAGQITPNKQVGENLGPCIDRPDLSEQPIKDHFPFGMVTQLLEEHILKPVTIAAADKILEDLFGIPMDRNRFKKISDRYRRT